MLRLEDRPGIAAVDGSPVVGQTVILRRVQAGLFTTFAYTVTGGPATLNVRAKIEVSTDGVNWHDLVRFVDQTGLTGAVRIARFPLTATAAEAAATQTALTTVAGAAVISDGGLGDTIRARAHTMLQALTGGTTPTVSIIVSASGTRGV